MIAQCFGQFSPKFSNDELFGGAIIHKIGSVSRRTPPWKSLLGGKSRSGYIFGTKYADKQVFLYPVTYRAKPGL